MTEEDALIWIEFMTCRLFGWDVVMSINPATGRADSRTRHTREAGELMRDIHFNMPRFMVILDALMAGRDVVDLWPDGLRETVRFRIEHRVPRDVNEPSSGAYRADRIEHQDSDWPEWLISQGKAATVEDHPPFPPRSELYVAWKNDCAAKLPADVIIRRAHVRKSEPNDNHRTGGAA